MSVEIDWLGAYYGMVTAWDATLNFWLTATFAVVVAVHVLDRGMTKQLKWFLFSLYGLFSIHMFSRSVYVTNEGILIQEKLRDLGIEISSSEYFLSAHSAADFSLFMIFVLGSIGTLVFIFFSGRGRDGPN